MSETVDSKVYAEGDVMRMNPLRSLTPDEAAKVIAIKGEAQSFYGHLTALGSSRELSIAKTKLEEAVTWAVKHITA